MKVPRKMKQSGKKVGRELSGVKRKVLKKPSVAAQPRRLAQLFHLSWNLHGTSLMVGITS